MFASLWAVSLMVALFGNCQCEETTTYDSTVRQEAQSTILPETTATVLEDLTEALTAEPITEPDAQQQNIEDDQQAPAATTATTPFVEQQQPAQSTQEPNNGENNDVNSGLDDERVRYDGSRVIKVVTVNSKHRKKIKELEERGDAERLKSYTTGVHLLVNKDKYRDVIDFLSDASMSFEILCDDLQRQIDIENPPLSQQEQQELTFKKGHKLTFSRYHRMTDIHSYLDYLASSRSDFVSVETIGSSVEGKPLMLIKILSGKPNATAFWIDGGTHAREWITSATALYIINELVENRDKLEREMKNIDFYILPLLNPDGYEYSHQRERMWRKNRKANYGAFCNGVDLNRNWGHGWGGQGAGKSPCRETYAGPAPFSEPETRAVSKYILSKPGGFKGFITLHSYGQYILYPWGYEKKLPPDYEDIDRVGRNAAAAMRQVGGATYTVGNSAALLYPAAGGADDWAYGVAKIKYSYTVELRDTGRYGFILPASEIVPTGKEAFAAVKAIVRELD